MNTVSSIKNPQHLHQLVDSWAKVIKAEEQKQQEFDSKELLTTYASQSNDYIPEESEKQVNDIIGILKAEMWGSDRAKRGFPVPSNKDMLINVLENAVTKLREAKEHLNNYRISASTTDLS